MDQDRYIDAASGDPSRRLAIAIPREEKKSRLARMSEKDFRDRIVRPVFLALDYKDGRDLHGPHEDGKDLMFIEDDKFGRKRLICVQTKKGNLNMSSKSTTNIEVAITQLKTAAAAPVSILESREKRYADEVILCASGKINKRAIEHIVSVMAQERGLSFLDAESLIDIIDKTCPELWHGISIGVFTHYDSIRKQVEHDASDIITPSAASDNAFVQLTFYRNKPKIIKHNRRARQVMDFEELRVHDLMHGLREIILVIGDAGSGKSTALWRIAYEIIERDRGKGQRIPIIVSARDLKLDNADASEFVEQIGLLSEKLSSVSDLFSEDDLESGRVTLLVDGLDEVTDNKRRHILYESLLHFHSLYGDCAMIVTTRPDNDTETYFKEHGARVYNIAPISWSQVKKIVRKVLSNRSLNVSQLETVTRGAQRVLRQIEEVHGFQITPLLAAVYAASAEYSRGDIPANITEVFKKYSELMLGRWDEQKGLSQQIHAPLKDYLLQRVAYSMHKEKMLHITKAEFRDRMQQVLAELGQPLSFCDVEDELLYRSRLLRTRGQDVGFSHLLLQEFFAGRAIPESEMLSYVDDPWWTRAIVFYYGDDAKRANHLREVQRQIARRPGHGTVACRAVGLALQACYLSPVNVKQEIWLDVIQGLSGFMADSIRGFFGQGRLFPMMETTFSYLGLRDAVSFAALGDEDFRKGVLSRIESEGERASREAGRFWYIVGLLESGLVDAAHDALSEYRFVEPRYYSWIFMGALFIAKIVPSSRQQKEVAHKICMELRDGAMRFMEDFFKEYRRTLLLEKRGDKIVDLADEGDHCAE